MDAKQALGQPRVLISRTALLSNARVIRRLVGEQVRICATVKADAYGHGSNLVADALANFTDDAARASVDGFAVATIDEAAALPNTALPLCILRPVENCFVGRQRQAIELAIHNGWILTICSSSAVDDLSRIAQSIGRRALVQVMIDTGMTRSGIRPDQTADVLRKIEGRSSLRLVGLCSHLAASEVAGHPFTDEQLTRFKQVTDDFAAYAAGRVHRHMANSGGVFFTPASHLDMVRPGISLLGIDPTGRPHVDRPLKPAMKWLAPLVAIHEAKKGQSVGYNQAWIAPRDTRVGVVAVGYADGYCREFGDRASMMLHGRPVKVIGRVSMDVTNVDLGPDSIAVIGDDVTVLDNDPLSLAGVYKLAEIAGTIPYEIFCRIGQRVARVAVDPQDDANGLEVTINTAGAMATPPRTLRLAGN